MDIEKGEVDESIPVAHKGMTGTQWKITFGMEISKAQSPLRFSCCIFKVPEMLRRQKEKAYEPDIVSIGPFHRGADEKFQIMENVKKWYLRCFLARRQPNPTELSLNDLLESMSLDSLTERLCLVGGKERKQFPFPWESESGGGGGNEFPSLFPFIWETLSLPMAVPNTGKESVSFPNANFPGNKHGQSVERLAEMIKGEELDKRARDYYSDPCDHLDEDDFIEMLILDGCFLIELFRKASFTSQEDIFNVSCMLEYLYHDLLLLENQLPWFVLQYFYDLIESGSSKLLSEVVIDFFKDSVADTNIFSDHKPYPMIEILHILDLVRTSLVQDHEIVEKTEDVHKNILDSGANHLPQKIPSVTALSDVGVKFKKGRGCILNITFKKGVFTIPPLAVDERTGTLFSNLMAYELCYHNCSHKIISYAVLMNYLIDTKNDVDLLCEEEIVTNFDNINASKFFKDLTNDTAVIDFIYKGLYAEVHKYRETPLNKIPWNKWRKKLRRDYFDTPWSAIFFCCFCSAGPHLPADRIHSPTIPSFS